MLVYITFVDVQCVLSHIIEIWNKHNISRLDAVLLWFTNVAVCGSNTIMLVTMTIDNDTRFYALLTI